MINVGIIGGGGYTAGELIRILWFHPEVHLSFVLSESQTGKVLHEVHQDLLFTGDYTFSSIIKPVDVLFLCQGHGRAKAFLKDHHVNPDTIVIDLGNDFRLASDQTMDWVYGLPETHRSLIKTSKRIANCGCFATAIQLALIPLADRGWLKEDIHISAITGSTGAGQSLSPTSHFSWRNNNISSYKVFSHQHEGEINQTIDELQPGYKGKLKFIPYRGNFTRGILATTYTDVDQSLEAVKQVYQEYYHDHPFVLINPQPLALKSVINTNYCHLHLTKCDNTIIIESIIDNLVKGASGQAVQNMNLACGFEETTGLGLKPVAY
jgi:N-acetyl-gamma-glutamyl-phosphate reductase